MLIEFSVANFRSFREKQTLSMVAAPRLRRAENTFVPNSEGEKLPRLLKLAAIYGPNASGKSNLIVAISALERIARRQPAAVATKLPVDAFRFDSHLRDKPSTFEVNFLTEGIRYEFLLAATKERIFEEKLTVFPRGAPVLLYERRFTGEMDEYKFGKELEGDLALHETWRKLTGPSLLFLSQAVANSNEELKQLRKPFDWISDLRTITTDPPIRALARVMHEFSGKLKKFDRDLVEFISGLDISISKIQFEKTEKEILKSLGEFVKDQNKAPDATISLPPVKAKLTHESALGSASFNFDEESMGTQNLVGFFLPWSILVSDASNGFNCLAVDEIDTSLHPHIVAELVRKHMALETPKQLIFTTHDTHLMDTKLLRRDQIWITERDMNGATQLRSIHEFEGREGEDIEKRYFEGRYRGLPILRNE